MKKGRKIANNCEKATFLIEKKQFDSISLRENLELHIHLSVCSTCRIYQKQSKLINFFLKEISTGKSKLELKPDGNFKHFLQEQINKKLKEK